MSACPCGHDFEEHAPGLPRALPAGERLLWQGKPNAFRLANEIFHLRTFTALALVCVVWRVSAGVTAGLSAFDLAMTAGLIVVGAGLLIAILGGYAWLLARSTVFSITSRRVLIRDGVFVRTYWNVPFTRVQAATFRRYASAGSAGDLSLEVEAGQQRMGYLMLWPFARPWKLNRPQPMLRALNDGEQAAAVLGDALQASVATETASDRHDLLPGAAVAAATA
ncbi:MAG: photosynthetic complex putative assembly protein PuhB [Pseudomonadota bacterium]